VLIKSVQNSSHHSATNEIVSYVNLINIFRSIHPSIQRSSTVSPSVLIDTSENRKDYTLHDSKALNTSDDKLQVTLDPVSVQDYSLYSKWGFRNHYQVLFLIDFIQSYAVLLECMSISLRFQGISHPLLLLLSAKTAIQRSFRIITCPEPFPCGYSKCIIKPT
jgi:hypothetical protein